MFLDTERPALYAWPLEIYTLYLWIWKIFTEYAFSKLGECSPTDFWVFIFWGDSWKYTLDEDSMIGMISRNPDRRRSYHKCSLLSCSQVLISTIPSSFVTLPLFFISKVRFPYSIRQCPSIRSPRISESLITRWTALPSEVDCHDLRGLRHTVLYILLYSLIA